MSVFASKDYAGHEQVVFCSDPSVGLRAIIAIHNTNLGPAMGGCRMWPYASEDEALGDVLRLSRGMTYKTALLGLPYGGGKAVVIGDPRSDKSEALLRAMGRFVDGLGGRYITAQDVGTTVRDMDVMRLETEHVRGLSNGTGNLSPATARGVYAGIRAAVAFRLGRNGLGGLRVAVQGLGSVGYGLCKFLAEDGVELLVTDLHDEVVRRAVEAYRATPVGVDEIFEQDVEVFAPCALGAVIDDHSVDRLKAKIVAGSANNQLAEIRHGDALHARSILYAPDFVINAGGVIDSAEEGPDYDTERVLKRVETIYDTLMDIFRRAEAEDVCPHIVADRMAEDRFIGHWPAASHPAIRQAIRPGQSRVA